jgi:hypothetical protein
MCAVGELRERARLEVVNAEDAREDRPVAHRLHAGLGRARAGLVGGGELVPGDHDVEEVLVDPDELDVGDRLGGGERGLAPERVARLGGAAHDHLGAGVAEDQRKLAPQQEDELTRHPLHAERVERLADPLDDAELPELGQPLRRQRRERLEALEDLDAYVAGGHGPSVKTR